MITSNNFKKVLESLGGFSNKNDIYTKKFDEFDCELKVDFKKEKFEYPKEIKFDGEFTLNFHQNESFVVFECVHNLLAKGYNPKHIELEKTFGKQKKEDGGGRADIIIKKNNNDILLIIECKTSGSEFDKYWKKTLQDGDQLFRYLTNKRETQFLCMYTSDFIDDNVVPNYNLISLIDNKEYIENNPNLESFKIAKTKNKEDIFKVWCETYGKEYSSQGIFEKEIAAYKIGKTKFTSKDLKNLNSKDIQGKYHEFATILRQHNVSGRENAFDKLVNLFLCKVTDEKENPDELKFYWKGKAYDNPFDFQDRLQKLYKQGMEKFLDDKITYIDNALIDEAFDVFKDKKNETKRLVKEYLKAQKFFTNNDFAFIDVHNESLFYQNFEVLLKIVRMIQDISLTGSDENQFLGDMFEGFLDQGVKQSEGQFFTPMPIVKFIINSLPNKKEPKVVDYACGAGHFLNEYASINEGSEIVGIEKEYRLSKVAKVSSFMYGSDMKIIYDDALKKTNKVEDNSFDVLIANPPYSVKGFLETLSDEDRNNYELIKTIEEKSYGSNNSIECFFIERSKQLVKENGVIGIIVPAPILNKGSQSITSSKSNTYVKTREIILKYFCIVAIVEFGSGTFGKTSTNTITLFLKRRSDNPPISNHLENMVDSWFECDFVTNKSFEDDDLLEKYCEHIEVEFDVYKTLLCQNLNDNIFNYEIFNEYKDGFEKLSETKNRKNKPTYKALSTQDKEIIEKKELTKYIRMIEKEKFYYFCLAYKNSSDVVIVKSPSGSAEIKKFLGYDWSSKKGNEGIKYLLSGNVDVDDETLEDEDKRILENLQGLKDIKTPLYNPYNIDDENKINKIIKNNFNGIKSKISDELIEYVNYKKLIEMLDFSRIEFDKSISLTPKNFKPIESKYEQYKISDLFIEVKNGKNVNQIDEIGKYKVSRIESISKGIFDTYSTKWTNDSVKENDFLKNGDILFSHINSVKHLGKTAYIEVDEKIVHGVNLLRFRVNQKLLLSKYAYELFNLKSFTNEIKLQAQKAVNQASVNVEYLSNLKLPLAPLDVQIKIVEECEIVDNEIQKANKIIYEIKDEIKDEISSFISTKALKSVSLEKLVKIPISSGLTPLRTNPNFWNNGTIPWLKTEQLGKKYIYDTNEKISKIALEETKIKINPKNTLSIAMYGEGRTRGSVSILKEEMATNQACCNIFLDEKKANYEYVYYYLKTQYENLRSLASGVRHNLNTGHIKSYLIPLPTLEEQKQLVEKIQELEYKINEAQNMIDNSRTKKEEILKKYL